MQPDIRDIELAAVQIDGGTQIRDVDEPTVREYSEDMQDGDAFPPLDVFHDGQAHWLANGFHRYHAARLAGFESFPCCIREGGQREALLFALGSNADHGRRRSNADKRQAVETMLRDPEWQAWSDHQIARACRVSQPFVGKVRGGLTENVISQTVRKGADGRTINTASIGRTLPPPPTMPPPPPFPPPEAPAPMPAATLEPERPAEAGTKPQPPAKLLDSVGREIPERCRELWARKDQPREMQQTVSRLRCTLRKAQDDKDPLFSAVNFSHTTAHLDQAFEGLKAAIPYAVCPYCHGSGCRMCHDTGLVSKYHWDHACAKELKDNAIAEGKPNLGGSPDGTP